MTDYTNNFSLPYPEGGDRIAVHSDIESLAKRADTELGHIEGRVDDIQYLRTPPSDVTVNGMRHRDYTGSYRVLRSEADQLNLPEVDHGILTIIHISGTTENGHVFQKWETRDGERWDRYILTGTDLDWRPWRNWLSSIAPRLISPGIYEIGE